MYFSQNGLFFKSKLLSYSAVSVLFLIRHHIFLIYIVPPPITCSGISETLMIKVSGWESTCQSKIFVSSPSFAWTFMWDPPLVFESQRISSPMMSEKYFQLNQIRGPIIYFLEGRSPSRQTTELQFKYKSTSYINIYYLFFI